MENKKILKTILILLKIHHIFLKQVVDHLLVTQNLRKRLKSDKINQIVEEENRSDKSQQHELSLHYLDLTIIKHS